MKKYPGAALQNALSVLENAAAAVEKWSDDYETKGKEPEEVLSDFLDLKETAKALENARKRIGAVFARFDKGIIPEWMEKQGTDQLRIPQLARSFNVQVKYSASILDDPEKGKEKGYEWLRENGAGELVQETVNAGTLAAFAKNKIVDEGIDLPENLFKVSTYKAIGVNKYTPKN